MVFTDMQKFPLRMKDNDLLVTELYRDPAGDKVTALSVYLTPKTSKLFHSFCSVLSVKLSWKYTCILIVISHFQFV